MTLKAPMRAMQDRRASIAVDLGAESCRVSLLRWTDNQPDVQLVHRFANGPVRAQDGTLRWPLQQIVDGVERGILQCADLSPEGVGSIAVDGWAVDYVRLDSDGNVLEDPFCYRDARNVDAARHLHTRISADTIRRITGVEQQPINTVYQLCADRLSGRQQTRWLNLPEYLLYRWGGEPVAERTNASHTQLVSLHSMEWSPEMFDAAGLDMACAARVVPPGTAVGKITGRLARHAALAETALIAPACHDTASAIAGIEQPADDWAYISCGTWSLVGTLVRTPRNEPAVWADNFTNLAAIGGLTCFHKGINGMWMLKQCMDHWAAAGTLWGIDDLILAADRERPPSDLLQMDDPSLMGMGNMPARINEQRRAHGLAPMSEHGSGAPAMVSLLLHSLAARYAGVLERVRTHTGKDLQCIVMMGGGAQNATLRRLTEQSTGLRVLMGLQESSTVGNLAVQQAVRDNKVSSDSADFAQEVADWACLIAASTKGAECSSASC